MGRACQSIGLSTLVILGTAVTIRSEGLTPWGRIGAEVAALQPAHDGDETTIAVSAVHEQAERRFTAAWTMRDPGAAAPALRFFQTLLELGPSTALERFRSEPPSEAERRRAFAQLPAEGNLDPTAVESAKLDWVKRLFLVRGRGDIATIVIDVPQAFVGLHARTFLLVSRPALQLTTGEEIQALAAHELGHDTFRDHYREAWNRKDWPALHRVELQCDGVAVITLAVLGHDPRSLGRAVDKLTRFNVRLGAGANAGHYPSLGARLAFIEHVTVLTLTSMRRLVERDAPTSSVKR